MEDNIIDVKCEYCGCEKGIRKENALMVYSECLNCKAPTPLESKDEMPQNRKPLNIPKCPICGSTDLSKITATQKAGKAVLFGLFAAGDMSKTWKCNKCGSKF